MDKKDLLSEIITLIFKEERKKLLIPPKNIEALLEKLKEKMYINNETRNLDL